MKQFHYTIQTLIRDRRSCVIKVISYVVGIIGIYHFIFSGSFRTEL